MISDVDVPTMDSGFKVLKEWNRGEITHVVMLKGSKTYPNGWTFEINYRV